MIQRCKPLEIKGFEEYSVLIWQDCGGFSKFWSPNSVFASVPSGLIVALSLPYTAAQSALRPGSAGTEDGEGRKGSEDWNKTGPLAYIAPFSWDSDYHKDMRQKLAELVCALERAGYITSTGGLARAGKTHGFSDINCTECGAASAEDDAWINAGHDGDHEDYSDYGDSAWHADNEEIQIYADNSGFDDREVAMASGLGEMGANRLIINKRYGAKHFIGYALMPLEWAAGKLFTLSFTDVTGADFSKRLDYCKDCRACVRACPAGALGDFGKPDNCISNITQLTSEIPEKLRPILKDNLYGCAICADVCPFSIQSDTAPQSYIDPYEILQLSNRAFKKKYGEMAFAWRAAWVYKRNALIVIGNNGDQQDLQRLEKMKFENPQVENSRLWAIDRIKKTRHRQPKKL